MRMSGRTVRGVGFLYFRVRDVSLDIEGAYTTKVVGHDKGIR